MDHVNPTVVFHWMKDNETLNYSAESIHFTSLKLSDAGVYTCELNVTSDYLVDGLALGTNAYTLSLRSKWRIVYT